MEALVFFDKLSDSREEMLQGLFSENVDAYAAYLLHHTDVKFLMNFFDLDHVAQLPLVTMLVNHYLVNQRCDIDDMARALSVGTMEGRFFLSKMVEQLTERSYLFIESRRHDHINLSPKVVDAIKRNDAARLPKPQEITTWASLVAELEEQFSFAHRYDTEAEDFWEQLRPLRKESATFGFWERLERFIPEERNVLLAALVRYFSEGNLLDVRESKFQVLFEKNKHWSEGYLEFAFPNWQCVREGIIDRAGDTFVQTHRGEFVVTITDAGRTFFFGEEKIEPQDRNKRALPIYVVKPNDIQPVELFYNEDKQRVVNELKKALQPEHLKAFFDRMGKHASMPRNINILLSGAPGTGKTELARQLARLTNRALIPVDLATIRDKYVGESEKQVAAIFKHYRDACAALDHHPILLLNEADGLLSTRMAVNHSVDQMNNTMQNILLEQMENLEGIIIATTNLKAHLDPAFDRRFAFKLEMDVPTQRVMENIWQAMYPEMDAAWCERLSKEFRLTGGQIKNVVYRWYLSESLGNKVTLDDLLQLCEAEAPRVGKVGFNVN